MNPDDLISAKIFIGEEAAKQIAELGGYKYVPKGTSGEALKAQFEDILTEEAKKWKPKPEALAKIPLMQANTYTSIADWAKDNAGPEPMSAKDISTAILPGSTEGSHLSYAEMKKIVHAMAYGKMPTNVQMQKCSSAQYNFLLGKHYEFVSKGKYMGPTEEQLEFHDPVQMTEEQKYKQELNNVKMKLEKTDTSLDPFWTATPTFFIGKPDFQPIIKEVNALLASDFRVKAVQYTRDASMWVYSINILTIKDVHLKQDYSAELIGECGGQPQFLQHIIEELKHSLEKNCVISPAEFAEIAQNHLMDQKKKQEHIQAQKKYKALLANPPQGVKSYLDKGVMIVDPVALQQKSKKQSIADATLTAIATMFPNAATFECKCPFCDYSNTVLNQVIHMNDTHDECTREYIADYLETLDCDLQIKEKA